MNHLSKITVLLFGLLLLPDSMLTLCNKCNPESHIECHNETAYSVCINGESTLNYIECPTNYQCTINRFICYRKTESISDCPVTNSSPPSTTSVPSTSPAPSTTKAPRDPLTICREDKKKNFNTNEMDLTCTTLDETTNDWSATVLSCPAQMWFNGDFCSKAKPNHCL